MNRTFRLLGQLGFCALAVALTGCGDEVTDPEALAGSIEAEAIMRSADALPSLPVLLDRAESAADPATRATFHHARELWLAGTGSGATDARYRRRLAATRAAPALAALLTQAEWDAARAGVDGWIATAEGMLRHLSLPAVDQRIQAARSHLAAADRSQDAAGRARLILMATGELVETTPRHVARLLVAEADAAVGRAEDRRTGADRRLRRARRLKDWAGRAIEEESYLLAIQRAYYAIQLVEDR